MNQENYLSWPVLSYLCPWYRGSVDRVGLRIMQICRLCRTLNFAINHGTVTGIWRTTDVGRTDERLTYNWCGPICRDASVIRVFLQPISLSYSIWISLPGLGLMAKDGFTVIKSALASIRLSAKNRVTLPVWQDHFCVGSVLFRTKPDRGKVSSDLTNWDPVDFPFKRNLFYIPKHG